MKLWATARHQVLDDESHLEIQAALGKARGLGSRVPGDSYEAPFWVVYYNPYKLRLVITNTELRGSLQVTRLCIADSGDTK